MSIELVRKDIEEKRLPPVYLWYGEDRYSLVEALALVRSLFLEHDSSGSNIEAFGGKDLSLDAVVGAAKTCAFFSRRLVIVDDLKYFSTEKEESAAKGRKDVLLEYCQNPNPESCLILISEKANRGRKLFKAVAQNGRAIEFSFPKGQSAWVEWVKREVRLRGKTMSPGVVAFFLDWSGHQTGLLCRELDKLSVYIGKRNEISREDIQAACVPMAETTIFAMLDSLAAGRTGDALRKLDQVLGQEHYLKVHTMIVRQFRLLLAGAVVKSRRGTVEEYMAAAGVRSAYEANKIFRQCANFSVEKLSRTLEDCLRVDIALKTSGGDPQLLLESLLVRFRL